MNRLEGLRKFSSTWPQKQLGSKVTSAHAETPKPNENVGEKTVTRKLWSLSTRAQPPSVQVSSEDIQKSGISSEEVLDKNECSPKESISLRVEEHAQSVAVPDEELKMKCMRKALRTDSTLAGGTTHSPPPTEPVTTQPNCEEEQTEEEEDEHEDIKAPVELIMEFLRAVMDRAFQLSSKLCQMILIYEPDNPEASEFLPLIQKKLLEEQGAEHSTEDDDNNDDGSGSEEQSSHSSSCSSSSCSSSSPSDDDEEEKQVNRHKPCPSHMST